MRLTCSSSTILQITALFQDQATRGHSRCSPSYHSQFAAEVHHQTAPSHSRYFSRIVLLHSCQYWLSSFVSVVGLNRRGEDEEGSGVSSVI
ncbi:uncharacterized protein [Gossypium hirsutum]|uniref:Uncharacterized protein isoform X4 n=1 Tax=Gossypium hirsutum TaxID=3635 RepID=A0ABM3BVC6_GOSHI|nr:uncharacterized protein LOC107962561 isoform X4 [Gossypium hirsutum]